MLTMCHYRCLVSGKKSYILLVGGSELKNDFIKYNKNLTRNIYLFKKKIYFFVINVSLSYQLYKM